MAALLARRHTAAQTQARILQGVLQSCNWETAVTPSTPALDCYAPGCGEITRTAGAGQWVDRLPVTLPSNSCGIRTTASFPSVAICSALPLISYPSCSPSPLLCRGLATTTDGVIAASNQVLSPGVMERLRGMQDRYDELCQSLSEPGLPPSTLASLGKELSELEHAVKLCQKMETLQSEVENLAAIAGDSSEDSEIRDMAASEQIEIEEQVSELEGDIMVELLPKDQNDTRDIILEVRAGAGGDEGGLFALELFHMYKKFASLQGWRFEELEMTKTGDNLSGCKSASAALSGVSVYSRLKFENGVHRVQRVPQTETQGRIHTSTATVVVMPQADEVDIDLRDEDIRVDVYRASGAGGQHVNTTESAVRMTHLPTGINVAMQDERSQHKNRAKALKVLRARIYDHERAKAQAELSQQRTAAGTGDRSERIRTYNFKEGRITDHRVAITEHGMDKMLAGEILETFLEALEMQERMKLMESVSG